MGKEKSQKRTHHHHQVNDNNLLLATILNLVITIVEIAGGIISNSLALLSDALHNLSDTFATFIAYIATRISKRKANYSLTYGYKRIEILAAMLNAVILIVVCIFLFIEAWERIHDPKPVKSLIMVIVAMVGLGANLLAVAILQKDAKKNLNVKAAYVHLIGDSLSSLVVIIAAVAMQLFEIYWLDPLITILVGIYLLRESYIIVKEAVNILMQSAPEGLDLEKLKTRIEKIESIKNIHHLHVWTLNDKKVYLEAHVELSSDMKMSETKTIQQEIESLLLNKFNIQHSTLQFEYKPNHSSALIHQ